MSARDESYVVVSVGSVHHHVHERHYMELVLMPADARGMVRLEPAEGCAEPVYIRADRIDSFYLSTPESRARFGEWSGAESDDEREPWQL